MSEVKTTTTVSTDSAVSAAAPKVDKKKSPGLTFRRYFSTAGVSPYDTIEWEMRTAQITDAKGNVIFEQKNVETPKDWSMTATNIVASKYFYGKLGSPERETSVAQLVERVVNTIAARPEAGAAHLV